MRYWLMKTEPDAFSIDDLARVKVEPWTGVRNYQARNFMRSMKPGDHVLFYHSSCDPPGVAGVAEVASDPYPDPTQFERNSHYFDPKSKPEEPRWSLVDVRFTRKFKRLIPLAELREEPALEDSALLQRGSRLSVLPANAAQFKAILALE